MAAGDQCGGDDTGGRGERRAVVGEAFGAVGEFGQVRRARRIDEISPQTIEHHEDNTLHVNSPDRRMIVITTSAHAAHDPATMAPSPSGRPFYDRAARVDQLLGAVIRLGLPKIPAPYHGMAPIAAVHDAGYLQFLETAFERWQSTPLAGPVVRTFGYAVRPMQRRPDAIMGQAGYYLSGEGVPVLAAT